MAIEHYFQESVTRNDVNCKDGVSIEKWNSVSSPVDESENSSTGGFDCNICLDSVQDPVVTFCGHLFCWPCIYKWINFHSKSTEIKEPQCPVCKTEVSHKTIVPLYGRDESTKPSKTKNLGIYVPRRPVPNTQHHHHSYPDHPHTNRLHPMANFGEIAMTDAVHPVVGMFGEMVYARIFGNSETLHTYPNSYHLMGNNSPRLRRHLMQADQSLGRVCFFLFCCMVLCLVLF